MNNINTLNLYARVLYTFVYLSNALLIVFARNVVACMTGNVNFLNPLPTLAVITAAIDDFAAKVQLAVDGGKLAIMMRNASRDDLITLLRQLAAYVQGN